MPPNVKREYYDFAGFLSGYLNVELTDLGFVVVTGTPWELDQLPRQMYGNPEEARFGQPPPPRKRRAPKGKDSKLDSVNKLDTINEWPAKSPLGLGARSDAATSTTDLDRVTSRNGGSEDDGSSPRKVQKGQINALAKMLSALRR